MACCCSGGGPTTTGYAATGSLPDQNVPRITFGHHPTSSDRYRDDVTANEHQLR